ncbi:MAG: hypothetical protein RL011_809, partial [Pseudomonadota bacterium]
SGVVRASFAEAKVISPKQTEYLVPLPIDDETHNRQFFPV